MEISYQATSNQALHTQNQQDKEVSENGEKRKGYPNDEQLKKQTPKNTENSTKNTI